MEPRKKEPTTQAPAAQNEVYFEILPEIFMYDDHDRANPHTPTLLTPETALGLRRTMSVYGGSPENLAKTTWENVYFNVYNEDGSLNMRTNGTLGNHGRWSGAKYLGPFEKKKNTRLRSTHLRFLRIIILGSHKKERAIFRNMFYP